MTISSGIVSTSTSLDNISVLSTTFSTYGSIIIIIYYLFLITTLGDMKLLVTLESIRA